VTPEEELVGIVTQAINDHPRTQQAAVGPSELGTPCQRKLAYKLAGIEVNPRRPDWRPTVGTAIHAWLEEVFARASMTNNGRWAVETRLHVGDVAGTPVHGSCDLFDAETGRVWDWKTTTRNKIRTYRTNGPGEQYRRQAHLYGRGWVLRGYQVTTVGIFFWTRDGNLTDRHTWCEPYDEGVALDTLTRATTTRQLLDALGPEVALPLMPATEDHCQFCPCWSPGSADLTRGCPGLTSPPTPTTIAETLGL
jgi:hypothetical protein